MTTIDVLRDAAREQAALLGSTFIGSEHLFLGWLSVGSGPAHDAAVAAGLTPDTFRALLGARTTPARSGANADEGGLSSHAQRVITSAEELAQADGRDVANADDVLLALIREPRGSVARALTDAKLKPSVLKTAIRPGKAKSSAPARRQVAAIGGEAVESKPVRTPRPPREPTASAAIPRERNAPARPKRDPEIDDIPEPRPPERPRLTPPPKPAPLPPSRRNWSWVWVLYLAIPVSVAVHVTHGSQVMVFVTACLGIVPLAGLMSTATDHLAERTGPMVGALLNAAFGNATEVIVAIAALNAGYIDLVKASIAGSILSNLLLILGLAFLAGGMRQPMLRFNRTAAGMSAAMLALAVAGLVLPTMLLRAANDPTNPVGAAFSAGPAAALSQVVAVILAATYLLSLVFTLRTHKDVFATAKDTATDGSIWPVWLAVGVLALATVVVAVESELLVETIGSVTQSLHLSQVFLGLIVIPIIGNAAEHATAVVAARKGKTELAVQIAVGSSTQVALMVAPLLVFAGALLGQQMDLVFPMFETVALSLAVAVAAIITLDGESHWLEGVQLLALYGMIAAAAWFI